MATVAFVIGMSAALALDPLMIGLGLVSGLTARRWWQALAAAVALAILAQLFISSRSELGPDPLLSLVVTARVIALVAWASIIFATRAALRRHAAARQGSAQV